jgi:hypothetical protein
VIGLTYLIGTVRDEVVGMQIHNIDVTIEHLCDTCRFEHKCVRFKSTRDALLSIEEAALDKWRVDVEVEFNIKRCGLYTADDEKIQAFAAKIIDDYVESLNNDEDGK